MRSSKESDGEAEASQETDWETLVGANRSRNARRIVRLINMAGSVGLRRSVSSPFAWWWERTARSWVGDAITLFSRYEEIASDRLHAHILACLLNKKSVVEDNNYGKNSGYVQCWTGQSPLTMMPIRS